MKAVAGTEEETAKRKELRERQRRSRARITLFDHCVSLTIDAEKEEKEEEKDEEGREKMRRRKRVFVPHFPHFLPSPDPGS